MTTTAETKTETPLVRLTDAGKNYGNIIALQGVTLDVGASEVTCVLGDNGAGKSTLIKIIAGLHQHTHGTYEVEGEDVKFGSPREALDRGIATVYQDLAVVPLMPVWRNFFLGSEVRKGPRMDIAAMKKTCKDEMLAMGIDLRDVDQPIGTLSGGKRQCAGGLRRVLGLHRQDRDVVASPVDLAGVGHRRDRKRHSLSRRIEPQSVAHQRRPVSPPGDEGDVVARLEEPPSDRASDGAGAVHDTSHAATLAMSGRRTVVGHR